MGALQANADRKKKKKTEKSEKNRSSHIINKAKPKLRSEAESARAEETHELLLALANKIQTN